MGVRVLDDEGPSQAPTGHLLTQLVEGLDSTWTTDLGSRTETPAGSGHDGHEEGGSECCHVHLLRCAPTDGPPSESDFDAETGHAAGVILEPEPPNAREVHRPGVRFVEVDRMVMGYARWLGHRRLGVPPA
jgi:hypothetical protein